MARANAARRSSTHSQTLGSAAALAGRLRDRASPRWPPWMAEADRSRGRDAEAVRRARVHPGPFLFLVLRVIPRTPRSSQTLASRVLLGYRAGHSPPGPSGTTNSGGSLDAATRT